MNPTDMPCNVFLVLVLAIPAFSSAAAPAVEGACKSIMKNDIDFCVTSLQVVPGSDSADLLGFATISHNLSVANATATVAKLEALQNTATDAGLSFAAEFSASKHYNLAVAIYDSAEMRPAACRDNGLVADGENAFKLALMARWFTEKLI
ncbi:invertase inhibitor [Canna indica]|uniref:Invertase inhibitor n=1 Tax=Canna indica TaxID=4628 RepID=A0AAQ3KLP7_9LILI|nr:invertase inhibitor [Canna indica]